jgi:MGT family glycosyltransferase
MNNTVKNKKILFATTPAAGHFNPLTGLALYLNETGNDVRWYTTSDFEKKLNEMSIQHYPFKQALDVNFENLNEFFPERTKLKSAIDRMNFDMINLFAKRATEYFSDMHEIFEDFNYDIVICDNTFSAGPIIKEVMGIPVVVVGVMPLPEMSRDLGPYGLGIMPSSNAVSRFKNNLMRTVLKNILAKKSIQSFSEILKPFKISGTDTPLLDLLVRKADLFLQIGTRSFEYQRRDLGANIRFVGALSPAAGKQTAGKWFDERIKTHKNVILVTQGTVEKNLNNLIIPAIEAFKGTENLLIVTTGNNQTQALREQYKYDNVIIEDFLPYDDVMPHADVYVTNGGYGGVIQSLKNRLPIVAAGVFEGKSEICTRIGFFKYGIDLKTETPDAESIRKAVHAVLDNKEYRDNVTRLAREFAQINSEELCSICINQLFSV